MKSAIMIAAVVLVLGLYIFLRFIFQRICFLAKLERFAKKYGYQLKKRFWNCLVPANSGNNTIVIETDRSVYDVKLFGLFWKHCEIHFWNMREYSTAWYFQRREFIVSTPIGKTNRKPRRSLGEFDGTTRIDPSTGKERIPVLLLAPTNAPVRLTQLLVNHVEDLRAGDKIEDVIFADSDYLFRYINKREQKDYECA